MLRNFAAAVALILLPPMALGLGLGTLKQSSALNEPFEGRIEILGATARDFDTIVVKLADAEQFQRAGIKRDAVLLLLNFKIVTAASGDYIRISSRDAIREPFLNFLLELNWANGRMVREYTVLLDPPLYDPVRRPTPSTAPRTDPPSAPAPSSQTRSDSTSTQPRSHYDGSAYGPVQAGETLWAIANERRPDSSITVQQMMIALLRANPEAFGDNNINILKRGAILRMPDSTEINALSQREALAEVQRHHQLWSDYRDTASADVSEVPLGTDAPDDELGDPTADADDDARLELVAPDEDAAEVASTDTIGSEGIGDALTREQLDAQAQENAELRARVAEASEIIELMQRQVDIKDDELAALQARLAELGVDVPEDAASVDEDALAADLLDGDEIMDDTMVDEQMTDSDDALADVDISLDEQEQIEEQAALEDEVPEEEILEEEALEQDLAGTTTPPEEIDTVADTSDVEPAPERDESLLGKIIPPHIASSVPGGVATILGILALLLLAIVAFIVSRIRGREEEMPPRATPVSTTTVPALADEEEDVAARVADTDAAADAEEPITETSLAADDATTVERAVEEESGFEKTEPDFQQTLESSAEELLAEEVEDDPLEEVNVYLAYERFDQAEELVRKVIAEYPDEHKYKLRLLEVFYSSNNKPAYEEAARTLQDAVGADDALWASAVAMWTEMSPDRELFAAGGDDEEPADDDQGDEGSFVDITAEDQGAASTLASSPDSDEVLETTAVSLGPGLDDEVGEAQDVDAQDLDFDLSAVGEADDGDEEVFDLTAASTHDDLDQAIIDVTTGVEESPAESKEDVFDLTATAEDVLDVSTEPTGVDDVLGLTSPGSDDLLDVTNTDFSVDGQDDDILDITATGAFDQTAGGADGADDELDIIDIDISDTVAPENDAEAEDATVEMDDMLDVADTDGELDFDVSGLEDAVAEADSDDTVDMSSELSVQDTQVEAIDLTLDVPDVSDDERVTEDRIDTVEMEPVSHTSDSTDDADEDDGFSLSLQSDELEELSVGGDTAGDIDPELASTEDIESEIEFDLALQDTTEMESLVIDDTLELPKAPEEDESLEELAKSMEESIAGLDLDDDDDFREATGDLDLSLADTADGLDLDLGGDAPADDAVDFALDDLDLGDDDLTIDTQDDSGDAAQDTVVIPVEGEVEEQSTADEVDTKLNLAKAYIELGDNDGARSILDEVTRDGTDEQQSEAARLIDQLK